MNSKECRQLADHLFEKKLPLNRLLQEIAENFWPERADFSVKRYLGQDYASNLMTSYPLLCRRDLGDAIGTMLRDMRKPWFEMAPRDPTLKLSKEGKIWTQWATRVQRDVMYDPAAFFEKAEKLGDNDFAAFGMDVIQVRPNGAYNGLTYKCHHQRDVAWMEDDDGKLCMIVRKSKQLARDLVNRYKPNAIRPGSKVDTRVKKIAEKKPFEEIDCMHILIASDMYDGDSGKGNAKKPWRAISYDCRHDFEMESVAVWNKEYVISRWQTIGSQYSMSPAVVCALPEARLLQAMTFTLLEAGEKIVSPSMIATEQAVRSDVDLSSGGITWVDYEYDERLGAALRPLTTDAKGMPIGREMQGDSRQLLAKCFYLDKIKPFLPTEDPQMTAFQAGQIVAQYVRDALPLFAPMEAERNGGICEETFQCALRMGGFGPVEQMPPELHGMDMTFKFRSPLHDLIDSQKGQKMLEMGQLVAQAMALDKSVGNIPRADIALRDALDGIQVPATWTRSEEESQALAQKMADQEQAQATIQQMQGAAGAAKDLGGAMASMSQVAKPVATAIPA